MSAKTVLADLDAGFRNSVGTVNDPGASGTIEIEHKGLAICEVVTAAAEGRTLESAANFGVGQRLLVVFKTDGGDLTITYGSLTTVLTTAGQVAEFVVSISGSTKQWNLESTKEIAAGDTITFNAAAGSYADFLLDVNSNELLETKGVASAVNSLGIANAATATAPTLEALGDDANVSLSLLPKGSGLVQAAGVFTEEMTQTALTDTVTVTAAQLLTKIINGDPTAAATYTLPTAALLVAAMPGARVGDSFVFTVNNVDAAFVITIAAGAGGTADGTLTVAVDTVRQFLVNITNVTGAAEAYTVYGIGPV